MLFWSVPQNPAQPAQPALKIRPATAADDQAVGELLVQAFVTTYQRKMPDVVVTDERKAILRDVASKREVAKVLVAELGGQIVGTVALYPPGAADSESWLPNTADLRHLAVDPAFHGKGVAAALLDEIEKVALNEWKNEAICLHVRKGAHGLEKMYQKRGYQREPQGDMQKPSVILQGFIRKLKK